MSGDSCLPARFGWRTAVRISGTNTDGAELGDLDNDGDLDVFAGCRNWPGATGCSQSKVWLNNGDGQFVSGWSGTTPSVADLALGDLDNDGDLDAFLGKVTPFGSQPNEVWFNDGYGNFEDTGQRLNNWARDIELGDVDGDGDLDAFFGNLGQNNEIWFNQPLDPGDANRDGVFNSADLTLVFAVGEYEDQIASNSTWEDGDWNGDGEFESSDLILAFACGCYSQEAVAANLSGSAAADPVGDSVGFRFADLGLNLDVTEMFVKKGVHSSHELFRGW